MVSKSFITYACLFGITTSINAQAAIASGLGAESFLARADAQPAAHKPHQTERPVRPAVSAARDLKILVDRALDSYLEARIKVTNGDSLPFPSPVSPGSPHVVEFRDIDPLSNRALPNSERSIFDTAEEDLKNLVESHFHSGRSPVDSNLEARIKVTNGKSLPFPSPAPSGSFNVVQFRDVNPLADRSFVEKLKDLIHHHSSVSAALPVQTSSPNARDVNPLADRDFLENLKDLILHRTSVSAAPPAQTGSPNARDVEALADRDFKLFSGSGFNDGVLHDILPPPPTFIYSAPQPTQTSLPNAVQFRARAHRRRANSERNWSSRRDANLS